MKSESVKSILTKGVLAGFMIGIGGTVYLMAENKVVGAFLFSFGLFTIIQRGFALYTGKVGYIPENKPVYIKEVLLALAGNIVGTGFAALLARLTRIGDTVHESALKVMEAKLADGASSRLLLGFFCGILMYLAVDNAKKCRAENRDASMLFGTVIPVMVFILSGFNHSVADCFYFFAAGASAEGILYLITVVIGNALGGVFIPLAGKLFDKS